ncbi:MAG: zinc transporter ZntB [Tateyamaria sp.]|uniref:zinc transporter ZntB n=1 Tax=Tateyamaria sp. TaxID=1929288 RepID=UPI003275A213
MPICVFDISPEGTAVSSALSDPVPHQHYRWCHFDLGDPELPSFLSDHVPDIPAAALTAPETRPRCDSYGEGLILNLRGVNLNADGPADQMVSVRLWVTAGLVVTVRLRRVFVLDDMRSAAAAGKAPSTPMEFVGTLSASLMRRVSDSVFALSQRVDTMEDGIAENTGFLPGDLADDRRMAIRFRRYLGPQRDALLALVATQTDLMSKGQRAQLREQANLGKLAVEELDSLISRMTAIQDHHSSQIASKQAHNGYMLSLVAAIFLPLGFVTGLFGVNVGGMPGLQSDLAFTVLCVALVVLTGLAVWILRRMGWL